MKKCLNQTITWNKPQRRGRVNLNRDSPYLVLETKRKLRKILAPKRQERILKETLIPHCPENTLKEKKKLNERAILEL